MKKFLKNNAGDYSIKVRIASAIFALVTIQALILICGIMVTGVIRKNDIATYNTLSNQSNSRRNEIQSLFNTKRKNITNTSLGLSYKIEEALLKNNTTIHTLKSNSAVETELLNLSLTELIEFTKYNVVTGVFVIIDASQDIANEAKAYRTSMYIRDSSPGIIAGNNSNLLLEYGRVDIARQMDIAVDYLWARDMNFSREFNRDFYFKPINAIMEDDVIDEKLQVYGYWNAPFLLREDDVSIITYSLPLILSDGTVYGVIGFELDTNYVSDLMPAVEVPFDRGFYLLGTDKGEGFYNDSIISSGTYAKQFLSGPKSKLDYSFIYKNGKGSVCEMHSNNFPDIKAIGAYNEIGLYETYSSFYNEKWALICIAPMISVMYGSNSIRNSITISIVSTIVLAFVLSFFAISYIFNPIRRLSEKVMSIDPEKPVRFEKTKIKEINELSGAFEVLSDRVSEAAVKMFEIIELVDMPLGSFEINHKKCSINLSKSLFRLLNMKMPDENSLNIPITEWNDFISTLEEVSVIKNDESITEILYTTNSLRDAKKWFRMRRITENMRDIGVMMDVTEEIMQKQKLEFERNYDPLSKLLNRQAFFNKALEIMRLNADKTGIVMFADLDDLKFVNDAHGHETGDNYIKSFAELLSRFNDLGAAVGRISGDEFVMFMGGFDSSEEAKKTFDNVFSGIKDLSITAPDGSIIKTRVSVGLSYYPDDSWDINELVKFADYAMYEIKHSIKGEVREFNLSSYNKNSFVIKMKNILNLFIEEKRVRFAFQPIVDVRTGEIYAYESLMRPMLHELKSPEDILKIARSQAKLYQIEKMTFNAVLDWISENTDKIEGKKIFINSIPNQIFIEKDMNEIFRQYSHLFSKVVFEVTENEFSNTEETKIKMDTFRALGSMVAIDDYGSGYSNELALLFIKPDFLKIDMSIVRNIDKDGDKQQLVQSTIAYAAKNDIKIIAEGVETYEEMEILVRFGVDYIQGFYLARPNFEIMDISKELKDKLIEISRK